MHMHRRIFPLTGGTMPKKIDTLYKMQSRYSLSAVKRAVTNNFTKENQVLSTTFWTSHSLATLAKREAIRIKFARLQNKCHPHIRFCKVISKMIFQNSLSSAWSWLRTSSTAFCTAAEVPDFPYSAAANSKVLADSCVLCCDKKKEYSRTRIVAGRLLLMTLCIAMKSLTNAKLESLRQGDKWTLCLMYIFNIGQLNCNHSENVLKVQD